MDLRNYRSSDFRDVQRLLVSTGLFQKDLDKKEVFNRKREQDKESIILAIECEKVVGCVFFVYDPWISTIFHLGVHPDYRNQGFGSRLIGEAESRLKRRGLDSVGIYVLPDNKPALEFYEKRGYRSFGNYTCLEKKL